MDQQFCHDSDIFTVRVDQQKETCTIQTGDGAFSVNAVKPSQSTVSMLKEGRSVTALVARCKDRIEVHLNGKHICFTIPNEDAGSSGEKAACGSEAGRFLTSPMPGAVLKMAVQEGDIVKAGQCMAIVEAMKMETDLCALQDGRVISVRAKEGSQVDAGDILIEMEPNTRTDSEDQ